MWKNGIFGAPGLTNEDSKFHQFDNKENFLSNLEQMPLDWEYRNKQVSYHYNSYGHRSVEPSELKDGYLLFLGCSITEGIGLALEDCYSYIVAEGTNSQYYNLAISGSGPDMVTMNAIQFLSFIKTKPSKVIIQWPDFTRFYMIDVNGNAHLYNNGSMLDDPDSIWKTLTIDDHASRKNKHYRQMLLHFLNNLEIEIYELFEESNIFRSEKRLITSLYDEIIPTHKLEMTYKDRSCLARDLMHPGSEYNRIWAEMIITEFSQTTSEK